jgi:hypothetical protein
MPVTEFEFKMRQGGDAAIREAASFFMRTDPVHQTLRSVTSRLRELEVPYAVVGGMALVAHGYDRTTVDVDILLSSDGHERVKQALDGLGYVAPLAGSRHLRDVQTGVRIAFLISGGFPGDGKPKPVAFPDPVHASVEINGIMYISLEKLIELKLASGITNPNRLKDLADIQELVRAIRPPRDLADRLDPYVRGKYLELWDGIASDDATS